MFGLKAQKGPNVFIFLGSSCGLKSSTSSQVEALKTAADQPALHRKRIEVPNFHRNIFEVS